MTIIPMKDNITIVKSAGIDGWGEPIPGETLQVKGRVSEETKVVVNQYGEEVASRYTIYFPPNVIVDYGDEITFVDSSGNQVSGKPVAIKASKDYGGKVILRKVSLK